MPFIRTAVFGIPFSLELVLKLSELINCRQCGKCCQQSRIAIFDEEVEKIADYLKVDFGEVKRLMGVKNSLSTPPCPFWSKEEGCSIQPVKPVNCKIYPMFQYPDGRLAVSLGCQASIDLHNLLSMEKL